MLEGLQVALEGGYAESLRQKAIEFLRGLREAGLVIDRHPLADEVSTVAQDLQRHAGERFHVILLASPDPNAFCMVDGIIGVNAGALFLTQTRDELAFLIGHEMAHWVRRHEVVGLYTRLLTESCGNIAASIRYRENSFLGFKWYEERGPLAQVLSDVVSVIGSFGYCSRSQSDEYQADEGGVALAQAAGYSPEGAVSFFNRLMQIEPTRHLGADPLALYFSTHPATGSRIERVCQLVPGLNSRTILKPDAWYQQRIVPHLYPNESRSTDDSETRRAGGTGSSTDSETAHEERERAQDEAVRFVLIALIVGVTFLALRGLGCHSYLTWGTAIGVFLGLHSYFAPSRGPDRADESHQATENHPEEIVASLPELQAQLEDWIRRGADAYAPPPGFSCSGRRLPALLPFTADQVLPVFKRINRLLAELGSDQFMFAFTSDGRSVSRQGSEVTVADSQAAESLLRRRKERSS